MSVLLTNKTHSYGYFGLTCNKLILPTSEIFLCCSNQLSVSPFPLPKNFLKKFPSILGNGA